ncbi:MAG: hypothetical protein JWN54_1935 [Mycobacterium sp.]|nr:hypothetical protein [Mycobacterium sp.]
MSREPATAPARRLRWYADRLRAMPPREVPFRVAEQGRRLWGRTVDSAGLPAAGPRRATGLADLVLRWDEREFWAARTAEVSAGSVEVFGVRWPTGPAAVPDWTRDPGRGDRWPDRYCFDIPFRGRGSGDGDARYVWELHRLGYLLPVAAHAARARDPAAARLCARHIESWLAANPARRGIGWRSGIELAMRCLNLVVILELLDRVAVDRAGLEQRTGHAVAEHADWLRRFPSRHSSANNHRVAELAGLVVIGAAYPRVVRAAELRSAWAELDAELVRQVHPDGVPGEQATSYGALVTEWAALCVAAGRPLGLEFSDRTRARVVAAATFLAAVTDHAGHLVRVGDDDESRLLTAARPDVPAAVRALVTDVLPAAIPAPVPEVTAPGLTVFRDGGYTVARGADPGGESLWLLDHGPLGLGHLAAHAHADTLAVYLHHRGRPVFVDAGTYRYHDAGAWRDHLRGTAAHNTLTVEGADSSVAAGPFGWRRADRATGRLCSVDTGTDTDTGADGWSVRAEHDGYVRRYGVVHRRSLARTGPGRYRLSDTLDGGADVRVRWSLLVAPELDVEPAGHGWRVLDGDDELVRIDAPPGWERSTARGRTDPVAGWCSPRFGCLVPAYQLRLDGVLGPGRALDVEITTSPRRRQ